MGEGEAPWTDVEIFHGKRGGQFFGQNVYCGRGQEAPFLHDPVTLALAELPVRVMGLGMCLDGVGLVLLQAHLGAGAARTVFKVSATLQWGIGLTASWLLGPVAGLGLLGIWVGQVFYRTLQAGVLSWLWGRGAWARTEL